MAIDSHEEHEIIVEGKDLEDALTIASERLGIGRADVEYRLTDLGAPGFFGLFQKKKIVIRAWGRGAMTLVTKANDFLTRIINRMGVNASVVGRDTPDGILLNILDNRDGSLIGKNGQTLYALEYIVNRYIHHHYDRNIRIILDCEGYRNRREAYIQKMAYSIGKKVKKIGKPFSAEPMDSGERRIFHLALKSDRLLRTESQGEGDRRKVVVFPVKREEKPRDDTR